MKVELYKDMSRNGRVCCRKVLDKSDTSKKKSTSRKVKLKKRKK